MSGWWGQLLENSVDVAILNFFDLPEVVDCQIYFFHGAHGLLDLPPLVA